MAGRLGFPVQAGGLDGWLVVGSSGFLLVMSAHTHALPCGVPTQLHRGIAALLSSRHATSIHKRCVANHHYHSGGVHSFALPCEVEVVVLVVAGLFCGGYGIKPRYLRTLTARLLDSCTDEL